MTETANKSDCYMTVRLTKEQHAAFRAACRATETRSISGVLRELVNAFTEGRVVIKRPADAKSIYDVPAVATVATVATGINSNTIYDAQSLTEYLQHITNAKVLKG
jgi:hypothetical protein